MCFSFPYAHNQSGGACLAGTISLIQQIPLFSCWTGKPSRSISHGQAAVYSLELLLRGNVSSHGNACTGLINTWQKTHQLINSPSPPQSLSLTCNFSEHFLIPQCLQPVLDSQPVGISKLWKQINDILAEISSACFSPLNIKFLNFLSESVSPWEKTSIWEIRVFYH